MLTFRILAEHVGENGRLKDPDVVGEATVIHCAELPQLRELPCWEHVTHIWIAECGGLRELPCWPRAMCVVIQRCGRLHKLPFWPRVVGLQAISCLQLPTDPGSYVRWRDQIVRKKAAVAVLLQQSTKSAMRKLPPELLRMMSELL